MQLLSAPTHVLPKGSIKFNFDPKPSTSTLTLQVNKSTGQQVTPSVIIETTRTQTPCCTVVKAAAKAFVKAQKEAAKAVAANKAKNQAPPKADQQAQL